MKYKFETACSKDNLKDIRVFIGDVLSKYSIPEVKKNELILAVDEVCANLIIHSHDCNKQESFELRVKVDKKKGITFDIIDQGVGFNITKYQEPSLHDIIKNKKKGGVGLMLVRRIMDDVQYKCDHHKNICIFRLFKKINFK